MKLAQLVKIAEWGHVRVRPVKRGTPMGKLMALENINQILDKLTERGMHTESLHALEIRDGNVHHILALVMLMKVHRDDELEEKRIEAEKMALAEPKIALNAKVESQETEAAERATTEPTREAVDEAVDEAERLDEEARTKNAALSDAKLQREREKGHQAWEGVSNGAAVAAMARRAAQKEQEAEEATRIKREHDKGKRAWSITKLHVDTAGDEHMLLAPSMHLIRGLLVAR